MTIKEAQKIVYKAEKQDSKFDFAFEKYDDATYDIYKKALRFLQREPARRAKYNK